jgi:predicted nucleic acid-binding protein
MPVVSNTSPLLNLAIIDRLILVKQQFGKIVIPNEVLTELKINENLPGSQQLREAIAKKWITIQQVEDRALVKLLRRDLDRGESEAIALATQLNATWLLLDERDGRNIARTLGLNVTGVLGIILKGWHEGQVESVRELIERLRTSANFRISHSLERQILLETGELS